MYALIQNDVVVRYPYSIGDLKKDNPNVTFSSNPTNDVLADFDTYIVYNSTPPDYDPMTETLAEQTPFYSPVNARWEQVWQVVPLSAEQIAANQTALQNQIVAETQQRLDDFARTRGYDGILSACTYAASSVPRFQAEGQYCVGARDATWAELYTMLAEVEAGTRPVPSGYADIEPDLPPLVWPA